MSGREGGEAGVAGEGERRILRRRIARGFEDEEGDGPDERGIFAAGEEGEGVAELFELGEGELGGGEAGEGDDAKRAGAHDGAFILGGEAEREQERQRQPAMGGHKTILA